MGQHGARELQMIREGHSKPFRSWAGLVYVRRMATSQRVLRGFAKAGTAVVRRVLGTPRAVKPKVIPQSAVIPYRRQGTRVRVLLITSRRSGDWVVPKGLIEPGMTEHDSAAKEAAEEAGVAGRVGTQPVGTFEYAKWGGVCVVRVFDMEVRQERGDWPEKAQRTRKWVDVADAARLVKHAGLGQIIAGLPRRLARADGAGASRH